jgi:hypothetical protein
VGAISSLLGVAGGEFIIPILIFVFGADIRTAGTASVLISLPIVFTGVARHWLTGHYRSHTMLAYLVLPMCRLFCGCNDRRLPRGLDVGRCLATGIGCDPRRSAVKLWTRSSAVVTD